MAEQALRPYKHRDFGSLVSLGRRSTVGNLMGFLLGRSFSVEGLFALIIYRSLRVMHDHASRLSGLFWCTKRPALILLNPNRSPTNRT
jgi:NADH dehydrogenase FAD-containing subunit